MQLILKREFCKNFCKDYIQNDSLIGFSEKNENV